MPRFDYFQSRPSTRVNFLFRLQQMEVVLLVFTLRGNLCLRCELTKKLRLYTESLEFIVWF